MMPWAGRDLIIEKACGGIYHCDIYHSQSPNEMKLLIQMDFLRNISFLRVKNLNIELQVHYLVQKLYSFDSQKMYKMNHIGASFN